MEVGDLDISLWFLGVIVLLIEGFLWFGEDYIFVILFLSLVVGCGCRFSYCVVLGCRVEFFEWFWYWS